MTPVEDERIIELFFQRSELAVTELDAKYGQNCRALSFGIVGDRRDAEECVNDAYLGVWNTVPPVRPRPLAAYVYRVARNISLKALRRKSAAKRRSAYTVAMEELEPYLASRDTADSRLEARELAQSIQRFLDALPAEDRVIFLRRYWFSDSYAAIAERTGLTEKAVSVRLTRLRQRLKRHLQEEGMLPWM